ncbi:glycosyl hydrolase family 28-related protein [Listeria booriae]|uniref:glycosyl hydrolase family 28-related protein n=1 Tax=Listeria booriae TaxID=1552123 RepID=UPI00162ADFB2|nr:glycosyl hydrolase family 28-related protein [Listeria booriae]MBC1226723.1 hypothetical protein [Listeria booriae]
MTEIKRNNVKDFNAKGDGKTDDTLAIQNAIDDLYRSPIDGNSDAFKEGGIVYFPAGQYVVSRPIYITKAGIYLEGDTATTSGIIPKGELKNQKIQFDNETEGNAVFEFVYYSKAGLTGNRSFIRNIGMKNLSFNLMNLDKTTIIRLVRPYDLCVFENLIFTNIRGTAIEAISEYPDNPSALIKGVGQGVILRDIHIDNSSTVLDSGGTLSYNKLLDRGRPQDATAPVIHLENINESSLTNVKIIACGAEVDLEGNIVKNGKDTIVAHAQRIGILSEGCQGITIKESAVAQLSKPAIQIQRGTYGRQSIGSFHFIQSNTFEEITDGGIKIDGIMDKPKTRGVSEITISENRFLGNNPSEYMYVIDNCDLVTIRDRCSVYIGEGAMNTTVYAVDVNKSTDDTKILDKGTRSIIMGRKYNFIDGTNAYTFSTRIAPSRFSLPIVDKSLILKETTQKVVGDMVLIQDKQEMKETVAVLKTWNDGSLRWTNMMGDLIFTADIVNVDDFYATANSIKGSCTGIESITKFRVTAIYDSGKEPTIVTGGSIKSDGTFEVYILGKGIDILECQMLILEALDQDNNILDSKNVTVKFNESIIVDPYSFSSPYITGSYSSLIKSIKLISSKVTAGGTLTGGTFKFYAIGNMEKTIPCYIKGYDAKGNERASTLVPVID